MRALFWRPGGGLAYFETRLPTVEVEMRRLLALLAVPLVTIACENPSPTSSTGSRNLQSQEPESPWNLTAVATAVSGSECRPYLLGVERQWHLWVDRSAERVRIEYGAWDDTWPPYVGSIRGNDFTATQERANQTRFGCAGGPENATMTGTLSGRFSEDGRSFTAEQVASYAFDRVGVMTVHNRWTAAAR
jgi:hypothetical protein